MADPGSGMEGTGGGRVVGLAKSAVLRTRAGISAMPAPRRKWALASLGFVLAAAVGLLWYSGRTEWRMLFNGLDAKDVQQVSQELAAAGIAYELTPDGAGIQVPVELVDKARMEVAAKGMPQTGRMGFELFDKPNWVGSEFDEKVNYQRAMEGELEHTIATLAVVQSARVHLVLPQHSLFQAQDGAAKASVVLKLKRGSMEQDQVDSIRSLVAGAVDSLTVDNVTLVDAEGRVSFKTHSHGEEEGTAERSLEGKLIAMLEPVAGPGNVRATVNLTYDLGSEERTDEIYDPSQVATLSIQKSEQTTGTVWKQGGIPGTASNSPAASAAGAQTAGSSGMPPLLQKEALPVYPQGGGPGQSNHEENSVYGVTRHTVHAEQGPGRLRRVTAAILVNDRSSVEASGKQSKVLWRPRNADEMRRMESLAQAAVGFDQKRGDQLVLENVSFSGNAPEVQPATIERVVEEAHTLLHAQPGLLRTLVFGTCCALLLLFVARPVTKELLVAFREQVSLEAGSLGPKGRELAAGIQSAGVVGVGSGQEWVAADEGSEAGADLRHLGTEASRSPMRKSGRMAGHGIFEHVSEHIRREPVQTTRLLESWIGSAEETE